MITYAYLRTLIALEHDDSLEGLWDYLIRDGIPIMLIDEARPLDPDAGKGAGEPALPASEQPGPES